MTAGGGAPAITDQSKATPPAVLALLRERLEHDLARSPTGPARPPDDFLDEVDLALEWLGGQARAHGNRDSREREQNQRYRAVLPRLLQATRNALQAPNPSRAAWDTARRFLAAAITITDDLSMGTGPRAIGPPLHLIPGGKR